MELPRIAITGASGFLGRHLLEALKAKYRIHALARRSQRECGAPIHPNIQWHRADIADIEPISSVFERIKQDGGVDLFIHLAAYYDFTGVEHPEYMRTNVDGLRNILDLCKPLHLRRFIFASSTAACELPPHGQTLNELSPPDGRHIYARSKGIGENMLKEYEKTVPSCIVRLPALFSDWCEYFPLFMFFENWLSDSWTSRMLAGKGNSSIPYMHIRDTATFMRALLERISNVAQGQILIASGDGSVSHKELFEAATLVFLGQRKKPIFVPKFVCRNGIWLRKIFGAFSGRRPFESPWMVRYIDRQMNMDTQKTREFLGWQPRKRLHIVRRIPFMMENYKSQPAEWYRRNTAILREVPLLKNITIYNLLKAHAKEIEAAYAEHFYGLQGGERFPHYQALPIEQKQWDCQQLLLQLMNSIRAQDKTLFRAYCQELAEHRFEQGFTVREACEILVIMNRVCLQILSEDPASKTLDEQALRDEITMTVQFGLDEIQEVFEQLGGVEYEPQLT